MQSLKKEMPHLRFNVSVKNSVSVHVFDSFEQLIDVELDSRLRQIGRASLDCFVKIHFHELED